MSERSGIVTLTTDFGHKDPYVGVMKGVILGVFPGAQIVDLCHEVAPQDVRDANFTILGSYRFFPRGTVHVVVVDPGVGSSRRILCAEAHGMIFLAPDNGVLTGIIDSASEVREVSEESLFRSGSVSNTFHGRDIFAPVAAHLGRGHDAGDVGPKVSDFCVLEHPAPVRDEGGALVGTIIHQDTFGNLITNIREEDIESLDPERRVVSFRSKEIGNLVASYSAVEPGAPLVIIDSYGFLEIALNSGNAAKHFNAVCGDAVRVG